MRYFVYYYIYDRAVKGTLGGPVKVFDLCDNLVRAGHDVVLFAPDIGSPEKQTSARVVKVPAVGIPVLGVLWHEAGLLLASLAELARGRCSVVYVRIMTSLVPLLVRSLSGAALLTDVNDDPSYRYENEAGLARLKLPLVRLCDRLNLRGSRAVLTINRQVRDSLISGFGLDSSVISIVPSGANTAFFRPREKAAARAELSLDPSRRYVCFLGSPNGWNDYEIMAAAAEKVCSELPDVDFIIAGGLPPGQAGLFSSPGLAGRVILPGRVVPSAAVSWIACAEVCLAPLKPSGRCSTPVKIFDYLSCARPVVFARPEGGDDLFSDCRSVLEVPAGDRERFCSAILSLLSDPVLASELGRLGREYVKSRHDRAFVAERVAALAAERP